MEIGRFGGRIRVALHAFLQTRLQRNAFLHYQRTRDQARVMREGVTVSLRRAVYIQMVGIHGRNDRHIGRQMVEGTVVFICLNNYKLTVFVEQQVRVIIHADTAQERIRA